MNALKRMDGMLHGIVGDVRSASDAVGGAAAQLSRGSDDLSQRTQEQASALEETAPSMEEMRATVKQNADNARQANQLATGARSQAERGGEVVSRAVNAMAEIKGRGLAVVASEVRGLAQRSATAAKEIQGLISDSLDKVRSGSELVDESGKVLAEIMASIRKVSDIVAEIASASDEQAQGIDQVNTAVTQLDDTTRQNAALVEEAASAAKSMEQQAQTLVAQIYFFRFSKAATSALKAATVTKPTATVRTFPPPAKRPLARPAHAAATASAGAMNKASGNQTMWRDF
ncbi:methyl-accepting chemotaxis protein [Peristeroidobacter agariperforans]|uniref:methyl-accepting chemotaxis protein n=1 Tax=Peristeroidobacter agariperforans TaxID=268404 RepID=UPI0018E575F1|nr:methyl-accepting chemotaxis protein [Peristeroidobacter agariperforans]